MGTEVKVNYTIKEDKGIDKGSVLIRDGLNRKMVGIVCITSMPPASETLYHVAILNGGDIGNRWNDPMPIDNFLRKTKADGWELVDVEIIINIL